MKRKIRIKDISGIKIGQAQDPEGGTGCTVFIAEQGMAAGLDVKGGGPASRESELLKPLAAAQAIHAVVLAGGSAFGLGAADGVMQYLEEKGIAVGKTMVGEFATSLEMAGLSLSIMRLDEEMETYLKAQEYTPFIRY